MRKFLLTDHGFILDLLFSTEIGDFNYLYRGEITNELTSYILSLAERKLKRTKINPRTKKRVFHIMVESLQNISKHQFQISEDLSQVSLFAIQKRQSIYFITTGNIIANEHVEPLKEKLDSLNNMDFEELTKFYKKVLGNGVFSEKGGAGLGLIEIARKSGNKLLYDFKKINENVSFFYLHTHIETAEQKKTDLDYLPQVYNFDFIKKLHNHLVERNIYLIFASIFEQQSLISLISLLKSQFQDVRFQKRVISSLIELLQNIIRHANIEKNGVKAPLGVFYLNFENSRLYLNTINYIYTKDIEKIKNKIDTVNNMTLSELEDYYNEQLFNFNAEDKLGGLGFVEIRLKSKDYIYYDIVKLDKNLSLLAIQVSFKKS